MIESSSQEPRTTKPFPDPLVAELQRFTNPLIEQGYADVTVASESEAGYEFWAVAETKQTRSYRSC
jgi:hypothetical protein